MIAAVVAYLLTGIACVVWDFKKPFLDRPAYARRPDKNLMIVAVMIVAWLPLRIYAANRGRQWGEATKAIVTFAILAVGGNLIG